MTFLGKLARLVAGNEGRAPRGKQGARAYAVGDIHGRLDLLDEILAKIEADIESRPPADNFIIFLGDLIDRGPDSAGVVERLRTYKPPFARTVFLAGNHEEVLLRVLDGEEELLGNWMRFGGAECMQSYGIDPDTLRFAEEQQGIALVRAAVPAAHREFLGSFGDTFRFGDFLFVHAGIRPGVELDYQDLKDLRWIREPFLSDAKEHGFVVVHGHTIVGSVEERRNRISIDTGAYRTGVLTAVALEDDRRWFLATGGEAAAASASAHPGQPG